MFWLYLLEFSHDEKFKVYFSCTSYFYFKNGHQTVFLI